MESIKFLTPLENRCIRLINEAQELFDTLCEQDPQSPVDSFNFGHYADAARNAILVRGARRMDPENLLPKKKDRDMTGSGPFTAMLYGMEENE